MRSVAKGFRAPRAGSREGPGQIAAGQALRNISPLHIFTKKAGVEAVARPYGINRFHYLPWTGESFL